MQLVLVAGFKPSASKVGPVVKLFAGRWRLCVEHLKDSILVLRTAGGTFYPPVDDKNEFVVEYGRNDYEIEVRIPGTEPFINIFAEYISGPDTSKSA